MKDNFSVKKILQALYYLQAKSNNEDRYSKMYLLKLIFFADRYHLRNFGWVASADIYSAMKFGPVANYTYDVLKKKCPLGSKFPEYDYSLIYENVEEINEEEVEIKIQSDNLLSESYRQAMNFALETYGHISKFNLSSITHDYPEWKKHEKDLCGDVKSVAMDFVDFFEDPVELANSKRNGITQDPFKDDEEFIKVVREDYCEHI